MKRLQSPSSLRPVEIIEAQVRHHLVHLYWLCAQFSAEAEWPRELLHFLLSLWTVQCGCCQRGGEMPLMCPPPIVDHQRYEDAMRCRVANPRDHYFQCMQCRDESSVCLCCGYRNHTLTRRLFYRSLACLHCYKGASSSPPSLKKKQKKRTGGPFDTIVW